MNMKSRALAHATPVIAIDAWRARAAALLASASSAATRSWASARSLAADFVRVANGAIRKYAESGTAPLAWAGVQLVRDAGGLLPVRLGSPENRLERARRLAPRQVVERGRDLLLLGPVLPSSYGRAEATESQSTGSPDPCLELGDG